MLSGRLRLDCAQGGVHRSKDPYTTCGRLSKLSSFFFGEGGGVGVCALWI